MSECLIFETPGEIDLRAFTTFGVNVKPNTQNPIGYFGTGLKYAVAVICRLGGSVQVFTGGHEYVFYSSPTKFRGVEFDVVRMKRRRDVLSRWRYTELPFTTELGKNWRPWQVFRELESNTRDEQGSTALGQIDDPDFFAKTAQDMSYIVVDCPKVADELANVDRIFLPDGLDLRYKNESAEVYNQPSKFLYYRGLRVYELAKPAMFTYNFTTKIELTEDRTLKYMFMADHYLTNLVARCNDRGFLNAIMNSTDKNYESALDFDNYTDQPSQTFMDIVHGRKSSRRPLPARVSTWYDRYYPRPHADETMNVAMLTSEWQAIRQIMEKIHIDDLGLAEKWDEDDPRYGTWYKLLQKLQKEEKITDEVQF